MHQNADCDPPRRERAARLEPAAGAPGGQRLDCRRHRGCAITAVDRLLEIGLRAGLADPSARAELLRTLGQDGFERPAVQRMLATFQLDEVGFLLAVTLFAEQPTALSGAALMQAVGCSEHALTEHLLELRRQQRVAWSGGRPTSRQALVYLTEAGRELTVFAIYRLFCDDLRV